MTDPIRITAAAALLGMLTILSPSILTADDSGTAAAATEAELAGDWQGTLAVGDARLRLVFHLKESGDGTLEATLDSPDQGATGIPVESVAVEGDSVTLDVRAIGAIYAGELTANRGAIEGEWRQSGMTFPLTVERKEE